MQGCGGWRTRPGPDRSSGRNWYCVAAQMTKRRCPLPVFLVRVQMAGPLRGRQTLHCCRRQSGGGRVEAALQREEKGLRRRAPFKPCGRLFANSAYGAIAPSANASSSESQTWARGKIGLAPGPASEAGIRDSKIGSAHAAPNRTGASASGAPLGTSSVASR
jgi:hypothetical protein